MKKYQKAHPLIFHLFLIICIAVISFPLIAAFLENGYFSTHDGGWAVVRAGEMFREIKDGQFPPRYSGVLNFGYGYPLFNFAYPFPYYLTLLLHVGGFSFIGAVKFLFAISIPLSAISMFYLSRKLWKDDVAGFLSALLYIFMPYRMIDLYVRGSLGESIAFIFFPFIFYLLLRFLCEKNIVAGLVASIFFAALILTHNIMAVYFLMLLGAAFIGIIVYKRDYLKPFLFFVVLSFLLSTYFWMPALLEKHHILLSVVPIANRDLYFPTLQQIFIPSWGYASPTDLKSGFSYQVGIAGSMLLLLFISSLFHLLRKKTESAAFEKKLYFFILGTLTVIFFLLFKPTKIIWEALPLLREINYPWTLLGPITFLLSLAAGFIAREKIGRILVGLILVVGVVTVTQLAKPESTNSYTDDFYLTNNATTTSSNELMPVWVKSHPVRSADKKVIHGPDSSVVDEVFTSDDFSFVINTTKAQKISISRIYYPGWNISLNGVLTPVEFTNEQGIMTVNVDKGWTEVRGNFSETPLRILSDLITVTAAVLVGMCLLLRKKIRIWLFPQHD